MYSNHYLTGTNKKNFITSKKNITNKIFFICGLSTRLGIDTNFVEFLKEQVMFEAFYLRLYK